MVEEDSSSFCYEEAFPLYFGKRPDQHTVQVFVMVAFCVFQRGHYFLLLLFILRHMFYMLAIEQGNVFHHTERLTHLEFYSNKFLVRESRVTEWIVLAWRLLCIRICT